MSNKWICVVAATAIAVLESAFPQIASAQTFGIELHNNLMPASGGMAGASVAMPQDLQSAINGNPATLTQFRGTQFSFGGAWAEPTVNINHSSNLLIGVTPYSAKSDTQGSALGNIGVTQDFSALGLPATVGLGFVSNAGIGVDYRDAPGSNGTHAMYVALDVVNALGIQLTDRLSIGASLTLGTSFLDGPFAASSSMQSDYALRASIGASYVISESTSLGAYWQTEKDHTFDNVVRFPGGAFQDISLEHPANVGIGIASNGIMNGRLLLAFDALFKAHGEADFLRAVYKDQWIFQIGSQYAVNRRVRLRLGYAYNENPLRAQVPGTIGGVIPLGGIPAVQYVQAQFASISQHRMTTGIGVRDVLPGIDLDLFAGGMFKASQSFGATDVSVESYWLGAGFTWRFGRGAIEYGAW